MVTDYCLEHGLWLPIIVPTQTTDRLRRRFLELSGMHVLRFMPPITVTTEQVDEAIDIIEAGIKIAEEKTARV